LWFSTDKSRGLSQMRVGKVPPELLTSLVYPHLGHREDVLVHAKVGEDCAVIDFGDWVCVVTTDPITGAVRNLGRIAVYVACNDVAATGAEPVALLVNLLVRDGTSAAELRALMREMGETAAHVGVEIVGGHSEVTAGIDRTIVTMTAIGRAPKNGYVTSSDARPGDALVMTKAAGLEGTAILATDHADFFTERVGEETVQTAQRFLDEISVLPEGRLAIVAGATAMHDATEGGVITACLEMATASGIGVELFPGRVPVRPQTRAICEVVGIDPLGLISSGAMLIATAEPKRLLTALAEGGIEAAEVGRFTDTGAWRILDGSREPLRSHPRDELWRALEFLSGGGWTDARDRK
jgi:hydrogenase maturation factor